MGWVLGMDSLLDIAWGVFRWFFFVDCFGMTVVDGVNGLEEDDKWWGCGDVWKAWGSFWGLGCTIAALFYFSVKRGLKKSSDINNILHPRNLMKLKKPAPLFLVSRSPETNITMEKNKNNHLKMYFLFKVMTTFHGELLVLTGGFTVNPCSELGKKRAPKNRRELFLCVDVDWRASRILTSWNGRSGIFRDLQETQLILW